MSLLPFISTLLGRNNYTMFVIMKVLFSLCGDSINSLQENMLPHKATKGADFKDTYAAHVNTAFIVSIPSVFAHKSSFGDSSKVTWHAGFKSYSPLPGASSLVVVL